MKNMFCKTLKIVIAAIAFITLTSCNYGSPFVGSANAQNAQVRSTWIAYWDLEAGEKDLKSIRRKLDRLSYFCAYFDENDRLFIPPKLSEKKNKLQKNQKQYEIYLSFVNDKQNADQSIILKDIEVLRRLFADDLSMEKHIDEIIALTLAEGYDGVEIDYERIWKDKDIGRSFLQFAEKLYQKALQNNLKLRIVLEPGTPFSADFFKGPEYVVMFYNLYGLHSEPGPKADSDFIRNIIKKMALLPGEKSVAIATGGCLWGSNGVKRFITETEARDIAKRYGAKSERDKESQCLIFSYQDKDVSYTVWYADVKTLNYWVLTAGEQGQNNISIWRLGGNVNLNKIN